MNLLFIIYYELIEIYLYSDRKLPVNRGKSTSSQLIRLMTSTMLPQTRDAICECLFVLCNEDGKKKKRGALYYISVGGCVCRYVYIYIYMVIYF